MGFGQGSAGRLAGIIDTRAPGLTGGPSSPILSSQAPYRFGSMGPSGIGVIRSEGKPSGPPRRTNVTPNQVAYNTLIPGHASSGEGYYMIRHHDSLTVIPQFGNPYPVQDLDLGGQAGWKWCAKCQGLFFGGNGTSVCPAGGAHDGGGSANYLLFHS
jgi:hypothetical protein